ncbi:hypothetical protein DRN80_06190 [Methanosarcinales archaeon]|nr:MAG: hypothetical protein DRN80_06190 [Methanosarcinales archaeon]
MLHFETIEPKTLDLLKQIQSNEHFTETRLVGGTALALQLGHRKSIDLNFFGHTDLEPIEITQELKNYGSVITRSANRRIQRYMVCNIQLNFVEYDYPWLDEPILKNTLRLASCHDIAAMKLSAITNRGTRKDFIDLAFLLNICSLQELLELYKDKFSDGEIFSVLKSLVYFNDAEEDPMPNMLVTFDWEDAKQQISNAVASINTKGTKST